MPCPSGVWCQLGERQRREVEVVVVVVDEDDRDRGGSDVCCIENQAMQLSNKPSCLNSNVYLKF